MASEYITTYKLYKVKQQKYQAPRKIHKCLLSNIKGNIIGMMH